MTKRASGARLLQGLGSLLLFGLLASPLAGQNLSSRPDDPTDPLINQGPKAEAVGDVRKQSKTLHFDSAREWPRPDLLASLEQVCVSEGEDAAGREER